MAYTIRPWRDDDADAVAALGQASISVIAPHAYSAEQTEAWAARFPGPAALRQRVADGATILIAADTNDVPVAYAMLEADGHLDHLFNHPDHTRMGLAGLLLADAERVAREWGVERLYTEASDLARPAFQRAGYVMTHRRDFEIAHGERMVPIHNWAMEKALR